MSYLARGTITGDHGNDEAVLDKLTKNMMSRMRLAALHFICFSTSSATTVFEIYSLFSTSFLMFPHVVAYARMVDDVSTTIRKIRRMDDDNNEGNNNSRRQQSSFFFDAMALSYTSSSSSEIENERSTNDYSRKLDAASGDGMLLATRTFPECIEQELSPEDCRNFIQSQIDDSGGHEVGDINIKIQTPRTQEEFNDSYWMAEVPVNIHWEVACDRNDGKISYPFPWIDETSGKAIQVPDVDCYGLTAGQCCLRLRRIGKELTTASGYDKKENCMSCFVHLEPMEPILNEETGDIDYLDYSMADSQTGGCMQEQLTGDEVDALDAAIKGRIVKAITSLESFINNNEKTCISFQGLLVDLYDAAVVIKPLSLKIGRLACLVCYDVYYVDLEDSDAISQMKEILELLKRNNPPKSSKENCIIIYTNKDGEVALDPTLGGTRTDGKKRDGICSDDSDCAETEWCSTLTGTCLENRCITNPPEGCHGEDQVCVPNEHVYFDFYTCVPIDCNNSPSICSENEYCQSSYGTFACQQFTDVGEYCG